MTVLWNDSQELEKLINHTTNKNANIQFSKHDKNNKKKIEENITWNSKLFYENNTAFFSIRRCIKTSYSSVCFFHWTKQQKKKKTIITIRRFEINCLPHNTDRESIEWLYRLQIAPYFTRCISLALFSTFTIQSISVDTSRFIQCKPKRSMIKVNAFVYIYVSDVIIVCYLWRILYTPWTSKYNNTYSTSTHTQSISFAPIHINVVSFSLWIQNTFTSQSRTHTHTYTKDYLKFYFNCHWICIVCIS